MLVIGDVCGKGPRAAGVTALARHTLRAAAMSDQSPSEMLETLHRALRHQPPGVDLCTVCLVVAQNTDTQTDLTVALAGHPPPLLIDRNGHARFIGRPGTLLGVLDPIEIVETKAELASDETLLLYTDGVTDAGRPNVELGEAGLIELCRQAPRLDLDSLLEYVEDVALEHAKLGLRDDLALLALRALQPTPSQR
jgi:serine phosphatase RsbU (regulator of sigma subunit)